MFDGCLVVVSHDNFFVNRVAEHLFVFEGDGVVRDFEGEKPVLLSTRLFLICQGQISPKIEGPPCCRTFQTINCPSLRYFVLI